MLNLFRRHTINCPHRGKGRDFLKCKCPIWADWTPPSGKRIRQRMQTRDWQIAQSKARDMEADGPESHQTIEIACERFVADAKSRGLKDVSIYKYKILFKQLREFADKQSISKLSEMDLEITRLFRESWVNRGQGARKKLEYLRCFFRFCVDSGWMKTNPAKLIKLPMADDAQVLPFTPEEFEIILATCDRYPDARNKIRTRALVLLMKNSGLRLGDAVTLARDRVKDGRLQLRTAKTGTQVSVPLPSEVLDALAAIPKENEYFFWTGTSLVKTVTNVWEETLRRLFELSGVTNAHSHRLRHTFAVTLLERGASIESVSTLLGHKTIRITEKHYAAWVQSRQDKLEAEVRKTWTVTPKKVVENVEFHRKFGASLGTSTAQQVSVLKKPLKIKEKR